jgi:hypothetical protein
MEQNITRLQSLLNFFLNEVLICYFRLQICELWHFMLWFYPSHSWRGHPLWSSGPSSLVPGSIAGATRFSEVVGLERDPLSHVRITEELLEWEGSIFGLENRDYQPWETFALTTQHPLSAEVGTKLPDNRRSSVGPVRLRAKATEVFLMTRQRGIVTLYGCDCRRDLDF